VSTRNWRPSWTTPGQSEVTRPLLDQVINRNLRVKGKLVVDSGLDVPWNSYTPTIVGYTSVNGATLATGVVATINGRWKAIGTLIFFYIYCNITNRGNAVGNWMIGLPPKLPVSQFSAQGSAQSVGNTDKTQVRAITGRALVNATAMMVYPVEVLQWNGTSISGYYNMTSMDNLSLGLCEFHVSGFYESA
jgi:hypothetical protein